MEIAEATELEFERARSASGARPWAALVIAVLTAAASLPAQLTDLGALPLDEDATALQTVQSEDEFGAALAAGDFDGDGFADLAVGVPGQEVSGLSESGTVHVFYGWAGGVALSGDRLLHPGVTGVPGALHHSSHWGEVLATGDFDGDGFDDLAVGNPERMVTVNEFIDPEKFDAGAVWVFWGSASGLTASGSLLITQETEPSPFFPELAEDDDRCGSALAAQRVSGGRDALWIGCPGEDLQIGQSDEGMVMHLSLSGRSVGSIFHLYQGYDGIDGVAETGDEFGAALASGDFNDDGRGDVAIGVPLEDTGEGSNCGAVNVLYGDLSGIDEQDVDGWDQGDTGIQGSCDAGDHFGNALAAGDFDGDGYDDLAIGIEQDEVAAVDNAGGVTILFGSSARLTSRDQLWSQDGDVVGAVEANDEMGHSLAAGDFDGDGASDLAFGGILEDVGDVVDAGTVNVLYGDAGVGLTTVGNLTFNQLEPSLMPDHPEGSDHFGAALAAGDFDGNGFVDLAIGAPDENRVTGQTNEGMVTVLYALDPGSGAFGSADFELESLTVSESAGTIQIGVVRTGGAPVFGSIEVYAGMSGSATPGVDFTSLPETASWNVGQLGIDTVSVVILNDTLDEPNETRYIELRNPSAGLDEAGAAALLLTILDDDPDLIFADGFQGGNTSAWSNTVN